MFATASVLGALAILVGVMLVRRRIVIVSVAGQSMEPTLAAGDRVLVRRTRLRSVRAGQIVVIEEPGITHNDRTGDPPSDDAGRSWTGDPPRRDLGRSWMIKRVAAGAGRPRTGPGGQICRAWRQPGDEHGLPVPRLRPR
jgi:signal peptidase I